MELNLITDCDDLNLDFSGWRGFTLDFFEQEETSLDFNLRVRPVVGFCPDKLSLGTLLYFRQVLIKNNNFTIHY